MPTDSSELDLISANIRHRRSIKPMDMDPSRPVEQSLLTTLLENANYAPTHGMTEPWRFHIFTGTARNELAAKMQAVYKETTPATEFREDKMRKMSENPLLASAVITIGMARLGGAKVPEWEELAAVSCAVQNIHLTATAAGLAAYWSSPPLVGTPPFLEWLGMGPEDRCLGLFYIGWPKPGFVWPEGRRKPIEEKIHWHSEGSAS